MLRSDTDRNSGGIAFQVRADLCFNSKNIFSISIDRFFCFFFDLLILEVKPISTGISYRRPNVNTFLDIFFNKLTHIDLHKNEVYFLGDFNVNLLLNDKCILKFILTMLNIFLIGYHSRTYVTRNKQHFLPS